ncbi:hypothetical protein Dsin_004416 [Dipteronia sinensis]|uniref:Uncharacterized protein n=1 Tax=Dipteronia sinensis TaxID=43782 RepID=A0AAE0BAZ4_9ROSI|nr:hypothetical protein Dsin_004416 [Dipteronia sinensis]
MHGFSTVDGFVEITESLAEMIKYVANEPSVGLFYIQQHTQSAVPNLVNLKNIVVEKSHETSLHTEDLEDSNTMVRSMKECGFVIADDMIKDIKKSLVLMSTKQPKRGLIHRQTSGFQMRKTSPWASVSWGRSSVLAPQDDEKNSNYFSTVFKSAREKANNFKWPQPESKDTTVAQIEQLLPYPPQLLSFASAESSSSQPDMEADELPVSSQVVDEPHEEEGKEETAADASSSHHNLFSLTENFDDFKADKEAKLEEWLKKTDTNLDNDLKKASEVLGL